MSYDMTRFNYDQWDNIKKIIEDRKKRLKLNKTKENFVMDLFKEQMGYEFDINNPKTFDEYINSFKVNYKKDKKNNYSNLTDKYKVKKYITDKIGNKYLIPHYFCKKKIRVKDLEKLPDGFVLKTNNGSGTNYIVKDKSKEDLQKVCDYINDLLTIEYCYLWGEFHYKNIKPRIIAEELLVDKKGNIPDDLKCFCFKDSDGVKRKILYYERVIGDERYRINFDENWKIINVKSNFMPLDIKVSKPKNFKEILNVIDRLSDDFNFVRVDLFLFQNNIYFGELTFTPTAGYLKFEDDTDATWGTWINKQCKK